jgi:hypothetical protein
LADAVGSVAFLFRQTSPRDQRYSHDELHDEVEVCPEGGTGADKTFIGKKDKTTNHGFHPQISDSQ